MCRWPSGTEDLQAPTADRIARVTDPALVRLARCQPPGGASLTSNGPGRSAKRARKESNSRIPPQHLNPTPSLESPPLTGARLACAPPGTGCRGRGCVAFFRRRPSTWRRCQAEDCMAVPGDTYPRRHRPLRGEPTPPPWAGSAKAESSLRTANGAHGPPVIPGGSSGRSARRRGASRSNATSDTPHRRGRREPARDQERGGGPRPSSQGEGSTANRQRAELPACPCSDPPC